MDASSLSSSSSWVALDLGGYAGFVLLFMTAVFAFEAALDALQLRRCVANAASARAPELLRRHVSADEFVEAQRYSAAKLRFGLVHSTFETAYSLAYLGGGWLAWQWALSSRLAAAWGVGGVRFAPALVFMLVETAAGKVRALPFSLYSTFVLEQRFGFNKTTARTFAADQLKMLALNVVLGAPLLAGLLAVLEWGGERLWLYAWLFAVAATFFLVAIYPTAIAPLFNEYKALASGELRARLEALCTRVGFPLSEIYVVDGSTRSAHSNAYFYGFLRKRIVLFDTLLDDAKTRTDEVVAIVGHELGHWHHAHMRVNLAISCAHMLAFFYTFGRFQRDAALFAAFGFDGDARPTFVGLLLFGMLFSPIDHVTGLLMHIVSRRMEYQADEYAVTLGLGDTLRSGLLSIHRDNKSNTDPHPWWSAYHHTHPTLIERMRAIDALERRRKAGGDKKNG